MAGSKQLQIGKRSDEVALSETLGRISVDRFNKIVSQHGLDRYAVLEIKTVHEGSISYVNKLLNEGFKFLYVQAAYQLRDEIGSLNDPNGSRGLLVTEFGLPIKKGVICLQQIFPDAEELTGELISDVAYMFSQIANECPKVKTWSTIIDITVDVLKSQGEIELFLDKRLNEISDMIVDQLRRHSDELLDQSY